MADLAHDLLTDKTIYGEGLNFLEKLFLDEQSHEAGVKLLTQVLQDPRFMDEAKVFGTDLIAWVLVQPRV